jgi:glycosyltransferase involved in cell wall biosynthesis
MAQKNITVVIPTYNEEDYIKDCLEAVFAQTILPDEVIVVDNNSSDKTLEVVSKFPDVKIMSENRQGQVFARITGFNAVKTRWIASLDADSVIDKTWIEQMMQHASIKNQAFSSYIYPNEGPFRLAATLLGNFFAFTVNRLISGQDLLLGSNFVISRKVWQMIKADISLRTDLWEDLEIGLLAAKNGFPTSLVKTQNVQISARAASLGPRKIYRRLLGWPKTYWKYKKIAAILSVIILHIAFVFVILFKLPSILHGHAKKKYSGWS